MSLESLLKPAKWLDQKVQKQFTRLGQKIPAKHLCKVTTAFQAVGDILFIGGAAGWSQYSMGSRASIAEISSVFLGSMVFGGLNGVDIIYNIMGLRGRIRKDTDGNAIAIDHLQDICSRYNKSVRLPLFLVGAGLLGKAVYDVANYSINGEQLTPAATASASIGVGLLSCAASMYLKDQDPKLLKKQPSKVKAFVNKMYEKVQDLLPQPRPALQPVPVCTRYSNIEDYVLNGTSKDKQNY